MIQDKDNNPLNSDYTTSSDLSGLSSAEEKWKAKDVWSKKSKTKVKRKKKTASGIYQKPAKTLKKTNFINEKVKKR